MEGNVNESRRKWRGNDHIPAHHQLIGDHSSGVADYIEEVIDVLGMSALPCTVGGVTWSWVIVTGRERVQLFQEPVIGVDLRSLYSAGPESVRGRERAEVIVDSLSLRYPRALATGSLRVLITAGGKRD